MASLLMDLSDEKFDCLESIASAQRKTVSELLTEQVDSLLAVERRSWSHSVQPLLDAMRGEPHLSREDMYELRKAIASGRQPMEDRDLFSE